MRTVNASMSGRACQVSRYDGIGSLNKPTPRGEVKMFTGDHYVEIIYPRDVRPGDAEKGLKLSGSEENPVTLSRTGFVIPEDAARALGIWQPSEAELLERQTKETSSEATKAASPTSGTAGAGSGPKL